MSPTQSPNSGSLRRTSCISVLIHQKTPLSCPGHLAQWLQFKWERTTPQCHPAAPHTIRPPSEVASRPQMPPNPTKHSLT